MSLTNQMINGRRERDCISITHERKYYRSGGTFVKRSLRPKEWQVSQFKGTIHVPRKGRERILNEAATLQFLKENSTVPVPRLYCCFEDDDAVYLVMEYIEGVSMADLTEDQRATVERELGKHIQQLHALRSSKLGGPSGLVIPPYRAMQKTFRDDWELQPSDEDDYVFCHNDLSQQNVIVDPASLEIKAIIDWEYAGFYPAYFERTFFKRKGPSAAINDETDDSELNTMVREEIKLKLVVFVVYSTVATTSLVSSSPSSSPSSSSISNIPYL
ncbi:conserved hypothetical protein [Microsporum canis CBS 113480]|uniref:Aminoglycoside phosphotransferase domain-containing protein n=1 Tax=Arthroderma otae (strain ATCC MYA-4605 / CBS 113480) TaxID=554155 RepID=C5FX27_ARTOC|nr:conserved hypothetical protein [Microsporum canis CBS 113480]EEQ34867.1 conserved hypothetical protein [Microsporum canis CBS 113480]